jgi:hypothetical protein
MTSAVIPARDSKHTRMARHRLTEARSVLVRGLEDAQSSLGAEADSQHMDVAVKIAAVLGRVRVTLARRHIGEKRLLVLGSWCIHIHERACHASTYVCMHVCMHVCIMCVYICIYIYMYIYLYTLRKESHVTLYKHI